jgi:C4-dicarboxylate transporter DctQ subunit
VKKIINFISSAKIEYVLAVISTLSMIIIMFTNVVTRYLFNFTFSWGDEAVRYFNLVAAFAAISACFKCGTHISIDVFVENIIPTNLRKYFRFISYILSLIFCIMICYFGFVLTKNQFKMGQESTALGIPMFVLYAIIPVSMILSSIQILIKIFYEKAYLKDSAQ